MKRDSKHKRHIYYLAHKRRRRKLTKISAKNIAFSQIVVLVGSLAAGALLESNKKAFVYFAGALLVLPAVVDLTSSVGASLGAKINHALDARKRSKLVVFVESVVSSLAIVAGAGAIMGLVSGFIASKFFEGDFWQVFALLELSSILAAMIGFPIIGLMSIAFRRFQINPDDVVGPIEDAVMYVLVIITITGVIGWTL